MPKFTIDQPHALPFDEARARAGRLCAILNTTRLCAILNGLTTTWPSETEAHLTRTGMSGTLTIAPAFLRLQFHLSFALAPLRRDIEASIRTELAHLFPDKSKE